jgi:hypothetical protein
MDWAKHGPELFAAIEDAIAKNDLRRLDKAAMRAHRARNREGRLEFFAARFGSGWAVCRPTAANKKKYSRCISYREYVQAEEDYLDGMTP